MSRKEIVGENFTIAFGVDHVTGAFVQLWLNPADDQDAAIVRIDSGGVDQLYDDPIVSESVQRHVDRLVQRFKDFRASRPGERPNLGEMDVIDLAKAAGGFSDISAEVYKIFSEDV